ncbi:MAG: NifU family protein [Candidatus Aphodocola sp.]
MNKTEEKIKEVLEKIRPYLNHDGGDVEFVKFEDDICYVRLKGACAGCMFADMTISNTVEEILIAEVPEVIKVINSEEA